MNKDYGYICLIVILIIGFNVHLTNEKDRIYQACYDIIDSASALEEHYSKKNSGE